MDDFESLTIHDRKIIIGVDFGTSYSGISWAETKRPDRRTHIEQWPIDEVNKEGQNSEKVPTVLHYTDSGVLWGFQVNATIPFKKRVEWFKLGLDPNSAKDSWTNPSGRSVEALVTDFLSALQKHTMFVLEGKLGAGVLCTTPIEFILTVPAIWSEVAKQKTLEACQNAGLSEETPITLVSEPEAAAIYALHGLDPHILQEGETFVVCDAGGGTVDLISYTITRLRPILEVEEAAAGSGGMCGSTFLNRSFAAFLKDKLSLEDEWDEDVLGEALERFDSVIKKQFSMNDPASQVYNVPVPGMADNPSLGIRRGKFALQNKDLRAIFDPIIDEIILLVKEQILTTETDVKAVLLVGGFGANAYLKDCLQAAVGSKIEVMRPPNSWLAVANGAVMKGLAEASVVLNMVSVKSRTARKHYGIELGIPYVHALHHSIQHKRFMDEKDGIYRIQGMEWFIKKGDRVSENQPYTNWFHKCNLVSAGRISSVNVSILSDQTSSSAPLEKTGNVTILVHLKADLRKIPTSALDQVIGQDGKLYYQVDCHIEAVYLSASTVYTLVHKGIRYDSVTVEYV